MIHDYRTIDLFGKMLFEKIILTPPFKKTNAMPDEACYLYIMDGEYNSISEQEQMRIKAGESVLMKCGNYLSQMYASPIANRYEAVAVHFFPDVMRKVYDNTIPQFLKQPQPLPEKGGMTRLSSDLILQKYIDSILFYFEHPSIANEEILVLKLKEIILLLNQTSEAPKIRAILSNLFNPQTFTFREIVDAHIFSSVGLAELAQLTNMSLSTFKREFNRIYQESPASYLKERKLQKAAERLTVSKARLGEIAFDCGFNNLSHFSKAFKTRFGTSPSEYRLSQTENH